MPLGDPPVICFFIHAFGGPSSDLLLYPCLRGSSSDLLLYPCLRGSSSDLLLYPCLWGTLQWSASLSMPLGDPPVICFFIHALGDPPVICFFIHAFGGPSSDLLLYPCLWGTLQWSASLSMPLGDPPVICFFIHALGDPPVICFFIHAFGGPSSDLLLYPCLWGILQWSASLSMP